MTSRLMNTLTGDQPNTPNRVRRQNLAVAMIQAKLGWNTATTRTPAGREEVKAVYLEITRGENLEDIYERLPLCSERHKQNNPTVDTVEEDWRDETIDELNRLATSGYKRMDESYRRIKCGYVYQIRQRHTHWLSKVGYSGNPAHRVKTANTFHMPQEEFIIVKAWPVKDMARAEAFVHRFLADKRVSTKEIFRGHYAEITALIDVAMMEYYDGEV